MHSWFPDQWSCKSGPVPGSAMAPVPCHHTSTSSSRVVAQLFWSSLLIHASPRPARHNYLAGSTHPNHGRRSQWKSGNPGSPLPSDICPFPQFGKYLVGKVDGFLLPLSNSMLPPVATLTRGAGGWWGGGILVTYWILSRPGDIRHHTPAVNRWAVAVEHRSWGCRRTLKMNI